MDWKYPLSKPIIGPEEEAAVIKVIRSGWLSMGPRTKEFEQRFAETIGCKHAIAVSSGTAALHLSMLSLKIGESQNDEIIQPAINFVAATNMTLAVGAKPVFADVVSLLEPTVDPEDVTKKMTPLTRAVVVMHYGGYPARMEKLLALCRDRNICLIEDSCHGVGYRIFEMENRSLGCIGDVGCFSFFPNKNMTTGEGGMITTNRDDLVDKIMKLRSHGMTSLTWDRHKGHASNYDVVSNGFNYRLDELRAAIGIEQLKKLSSANTARQKLATIYAETVQKIGHADFSYVFGNNASNGAAHLAAVIVPTHKRQQVSDNLKKNGIQSSCHYPFIPHFSIFRKLFIEPLTPVSESFSKRVITLPLYPDLPFTAIKEIIQHIVDVL